MVRLAIGVSFDGLGFKRLKIFFVVAPFGKPCNALSTDTATCLVGLALPVSRIGEYRSEPGQTLLKLQEHTPV